MPYAHELLQRPGVPRLVVTVHGPCTKETLSPQGWRLWKDTLQRVRSKDFTDTFLDGCHIVYGRPAVPNLKVRGQRQGKDKGMDNWDTSTIVFFGRMCDTCWALTQSGSLYQLPPEMCGLTWERTAGGEWWANCGNLFNQISQ